MLKGTLPETVQISYYNGGTVGDSVSVTWETSDTHTPTGGTYTFVGTLDLDDTDYINTSNLTAGATVTVTPVTIKGLSETLAAVEVDQDDFLTAKTLADLGIWENVVLRFDGGEEEIVATWGTTLTELLEVAKTLTSEGETKEVTVTLTADNFPVWATLPAEMPSFVLTISYDGTDLSEVVIVEKSELATAITTAKGVLENADLNKTEEAKTALEAAIDAAQAVLDNENATQAEVNAAKETLETAVQTHSVVQSRVSS